MVLTPAGNTLIVILKDEENKKGSPLTEQEVLKLETRLYV